ncbi:MAG: T9SS type A sorting domain-containing protein [Chitinophagales bacterium]|nr:T9SS type A sorting domain-containing protein [Bacteroidota bacterium]MCB9043126.1 T9SS type A sorting domain-containing protein [Chitinophagales bacterium]
MKKIPIILICFISIGLIYYSSEKTFSSFLETEENETLDGKYVPDEMFFLQRTYPDKKFALNAYKNAVKEANSWRKKQNSRDSWRSEGPGNIGGRMTCLAADPTNPDIIYIGSARGGIFKTEDAGETWTPIFDEHTFLAIGDIEIDPNDPQTIYAGTGDKDISGYPGIGDGLYKSTDGGISWENIGLEEQTIISKIEVHPTNSELIYVSAMGLPFERNLQRGLYKSTDGGNSWSEILQLGDQTGVIDFLIDPTNPDIVYAAGWDRIRNNQESTTYGMGARVYKTTDGGNSWTNLDNNWPTTDSLSRVGLCMHPTNPNIIYAEIVGKDFQLQSILKSTNGGTNWNEVTSFQLGNALGGFGWYFGKIRLNPYNPNDLYILGVDLWRTSDEGQNWEMATPSWFSYQVHADKHDLIFLDANTLVLATDGGAYISYNNGDSWEDFENIPITQFYRVKANPHQSEDYWGGAQDNGTTNGNYLYYNNWGRRNGGDGFSVQFNGEDEYVVYSESQYGNIGVSENGGFSWDDATQGIDASDRVHWDAPYLVSTHNPDILYTGTYRIYKSDIGAVPYWTTISDDLTDGIIYGENFHTISTIAESCADENILYAGTTDANVWRSTNGGSSWENITQNLPERYVTHITTSCTNAQEVWVSHSGYKDNDFIPHLHHSSDAGNTWTDISGTLPNLGVNNIAVHPLDENLIFVATDGGVFYSKDKGQYWNILGDNLPSIPVYDIDIDESDNRLIAGTFGRSIYSIDISEFIDLNITVATNNDTLEVEESPFYFTSAEILNNDNTNYGSLNSVELLSNNALWGEIFQQNNLFTYTTNENYALDSLEYFTCNGEICDTATIYLQINIDVIGLNTLRPPTISVYPNPTQEDLYISDITDIIAINLYNISGQKMTIDKPSGNKISLKAFPQGTYFLQIETRNKFFVFKCLKQ